MVGLDLVEPTGRQPLGDLASAPMAFGQAAHLCKPTFSAGRHLNRGQTVDLGVVRMPKAVRCRCITLSNEFRPSSSER